MSGGHAGQALVVRVHDVHMEVICIGTIQPIGYLTTFESKRVGAARTIRRLIVDEHPEGSRRKSPPFLHHSGCLAANAGQHAEMALIEIAEAADASVEGDRDEVE